MTAVKYIQMVDAADSSSSGDQFSPEFYALSDAIDALTHAERIQLRNELTALGEQRQLRNLYYDYKTQVWIGA